MSGRTTPDDALTGVVVRTLSRTADIAWFVVSAPLVLVATLAGGYWVSISFLDALQDMLDHPSLPGLLQLALRLAGILAVLVVFRAWSALLRRHDSTIGRSRWQVATVAVLATIATWRITLTTHPEASRFQQYAGQAPTMHTNWFPAVLMGCIAMSGAVLMLVPGRAVVDLDRVQRRHAVGPRLLAASRVAADAIGLAAGRVAAALARLWPRAGAGLRRLARWSWPPLHVRFGAFLLLMPPVLGMVVPVAFTLLYYGGVFVAYLTIATFVAPPAVVAALAAFGLLLACYAGLAALIRMWVALRSERGEVSRRTRGLTAFAALASAVGAWLLRGESPDNIPLTVHLSIAGVAVSPLMGAAFDGMALLALHATPRWSPRIERALRVLGLLALGGIAVGSLMQAT